MDYDSWTRTTAPIEGVVLHHGGGSDYPAHNEPYSRANEIQQLQQWEGYHLYGRGWSGIAYGYGLGQTGTVYRLRGDGPYAAHRGDIDEDGISNNLELCPVVFIGSGNHVTLSPAAHESLVALRQELFPGLPLYGHQEVQLEKPTACPGPKLMTYVKENRQVTTRDVGGREGVDEIFEIVYQEMLDEGVFTEHTDPDDVPRMEELAAFLSRYTRRVVQDMVGQSVSDPVARKTAAAAAARADTAHGRLDSVREAL